MVFNRDFYLQQLIDKENNGMIKIVSGIRRCGKSYLLDPLFKNYLIKKGVKNDHIIKIDLDERKNKEYLDPDVLDTYIRSLILDDDMYYVILDEIQKVDDFESVLNGFLHIDNLDVYVTGSNSKFLSSDIVTEFRGRGDEIHVYPLSFSEFFENYKGTKDEAFMEYIEYGGLPLSVLAKGENNKINYLDNERKRTYSKDIIERNGIQNEEEFNSLIEVISSSVGSLTNPLKLSRVFNNRDKKSTMTDKTIFKYIGCMEDAFLVEKSKRYDIKGKKYIETPYKIYFSDLGIRNSFLNFRQIEVTHLMENVIYNELRKRGYAVDIGVVEIRNKDNRIKTEIDFVCNYGSKKYYIQSALNIDDPDKQEQEFRPLINVNDFFKKIVITRDGSKIRRTEDGITIMNIYEFLLNENSLDL
ncbi:MAG: ATP-binding protein [Firmicutes bacterium]|nr:ATP-binding protein [Bacillota bacterium]